MGLHARSQPESYTGPSIYVTTPDRQPEFLGDKPDSQVVGLVLIIKLI